MKRDLAEINRKHPSRRKKQLQIVHGTETGLTLSQMCTNDHTQRRLFFLAFGRCRSEANITQKTSPAPQRSGLFGANRRASPKAVEEWERNVCENKAVAILNKCKKATRLSSRWREALLSDADLRRFSGPRIGPSNSKVQICQEIPFNLVVKS